MNSAMPGIWSFTDSVRAVPVLELGAKAATRKAQHFSGKVAYGE
jgi:hypothetical protein